MVNYTQARSLSYKKVLSWYSGLVRAKPREAPFTHVVQIGDPCLRAASEEVPPSLIKSPEIQFLTNRMRQVMRSYNCVGLSAAQIGAPFRIFLLEINQKHLDYYSPQERKAREMETTPYRVVINPEMKIADYTKIVFTESCESVRGFHAEVPRYRAVELKAFDETGEAFQLNAQGWLARIVQHEMDHLNGTIYTDIMTRRSLTCSCWQAINERGGKIELPYGAP